MVSGAFSATGTGTPPGTLTGVLTGATLSGNATGAFHTAGGGDCAFTGPLTAVAQTSFVFRSGTRVSAGTFGFGNTPENVPAVISAGGYVARFHVLFDSNFPDPSAVKFTGPTGSGISGTPADPAESHGDDNGSEFSYALPPRSGVAPGGTWSVLYKGLARTFAVPGFDANRSLVLIYPTVTVDSASGTLTQVNWEYRDRTGNRLSGPPSFMKGLRLQTWMNRGGDNQPESGDLPPTATSFNFAAAGLTPPEWSQVNAVVFQYGDLLGNEYEVHYQKTFGVQVETRLENQYANFTPTIGSRERLINAFVNVPFFAVDADSCGQQSNGPPFNVGIQNRNGTTGVVPYDTAACMERTSTTFFPDGIVPVDIFSRRDHLDTDFGSSLPPVPVGTQFQFNVIPSVNSGLPPQTVITTLRNAEANPATDFINIPTRPRACRP